LWQRRKRFVSPKTRSAFASSYVFGDLQGAGADDLLAHGRNILRAPYRDASPQVQQAARQAFHNNDILDILVSTKDHLAASPGGDESPGGG
jgi:hypothetical protein